MTDAIWVLPAISFMIIIIGMVGYGYSKLIVRRYRKANSKIAPDFQTSTNFWITPQPVQWCAWHPGHMEWRS